MNWIQVEMGTFLEERKQRFNPQDKEISGLQRIEKIDFSGKIYLSDKPSRTKMILIKNNDLVISGINVSKGAMNVYSGEKDILATIHYSSYVYDKKKIDIHFLQYFLKSAEFKLLLKNQIPGGIKTEIKPKHLLPLKVFIPNKIEDQRKIAIKLNHQTLKIQSLKDSINYQNQLLSKLKQSILQEAIQGKLSKKWRDENPNIETVSELLERVKAEKEQLIFENKIRREKPLPSINNDQIPFKLPHKWVWCRLGNVGFAQTGTTPPKNDNSNFGNYIPFIQPGNISENGLSFNCISLSEKGLLKSRLIQKYSNMMVCIGGSSGKTCFNKVDVACNQQINTITAYSNISYKYLDIVLKSSYFQKSVWSNIKQGSTPVLNKTRWTSIPIPIAPFQEQKVIVSKIELLMQKCHQLEKEIKTSEANAEMLMQSVLQEAFNNQ